MASFYPIADPHALTQCDNCGARRKVEQLCTIKDAEQRLHAGEAIPAGECPDCCALAYLDTADAP